MHSTDTLDLANLTAFVNADLQQRIDAADLPENLAAAVRYGVLGGGKRLRPVLTLLCCQAAGGSRTDALPAAAAIELVHCFSLVHDDLPSMDDDAMRRGRPTLHVHAGEAMAILAGDVMTSLAFECLDDERLDRATRADLAAELARATTAMIAGQVYDTLGGFEPDLDDAERLSLIHRKKTGALIQAACRLGARSAAAPESTLDAITAYADAIGLMFQIVDDLLDVTQSAEHIGKATGKDLEAGKLTFPGLLGIEASRERIEHLHRDALQAIAPLGEAAASLRELVSYMAVRTR